LKHFIACAAIAMSAFTAVPAFGSITFDQSLPSPGWFDGSGNPNGGFTIDSENGIVLGLRIKERQNPNVIDTPTDIYTVPTGPEPSSPSHAYWNYEFAIFDPNLLSDTQSLTITYVTGGQSTTVNPATYWNDDSGMGPGGGRAPGWSPGTPPQRIRRTRFFQTSRWPLFTTKIHPVSMNSNSKTFRQTGHCWPMSPHSRMSRHRSLPLSAC
jgi:hypothetical protein